MAARPERTADESTVEATERSTVSRRAPFSDNPVVGARGMKTQQRILDAALTTFGEYGYSATTVDRIARSAGCSRVSFYQYFTDKDDAFRHLAAQLARQLSASLEALDPVTSDQAGWTSLRAWIARRGDIHARFEPVFRAYSAAAGSDPALAAGSARTTIRHAALFDAKISETGLTQRQLDPVVALLLAMVGRTLEIGTMLRLALPADYARERVEDALTDVIHRSLFGLQAHVNDRPTTLDAAPAVPFGDDLPPVFDQVARIDHEASIPGRRALGLLLDVGQRIVVSRGYHGTRVDDLVGAAGISHGAFYRYFENKHEFVRVLAARSLLAVSRAFAEIPRTDGVDDVVHRAALRKWLRRFQDLNNQHGTVIRVWVEAARADDTFTTDSASVYDWGRRQTMRWLRDRTSGDPSAEAVVLLAAVETFGSRDVDPLELNAIVHILDSTMTACAHGG